MKVADIEVGGEAPCFVVAELGINHNGSVDLAKKLIDAAIEAGANAAKFQRRTVELVYTEEDLSRPRESPFGKTNGDLKRGLEFGVSEYAEIDDYCAEKNIAWFASPWDEDSVDFLEKFDVPAYKVASACVTDLDLLQRIGDTKKPVIISTGMCELINVARAYRAFHVDCHYSPSNLALLACVSTYPAKIEELNLERIITLKQNFPDTVIGYSHHAVSPWPCVFAAVMGAKIIEAHITLDRSSWGSDQSSSLEPMAFAKMVEEIRTFEKARGSGEIRILESEIPIFKKAQAGNVTIYRGGADLERLYLEDLTFTMDGEEVVVKKTDIPGVDMADLIARHKGRYALCGLFLRPGMRFLDFPCGSGYAAELLNPFGAKYTGMDSDPATIEYAIRSYVADFYVRDLKHESIGLESFDVIACIEGLEHIEQKYHAPLIKAFYDALKPGGTLIVATPLTYALSGPNPDNPYHLFELCWDDFESLLYKDFNIGVEIISHDEVLSTGKKQTMMFGICHKE